MRILVVFLLMVVALVSHAQEKPLDMKMDFEEYEPPSTLKVESHIPTKAKFPFIDIHNHQGVMDAEALKTLTSKMDQLNMAVMVNLSGRGFPYSTERLKNSLQSIKENYPNRFVLFTNVDFENMDDPRWTTKAVKQLEEDVKLGAMGLKIYKSLGLQYKDKAGNRIHVDDPRIDPVWAKCGELGIPVLIHAADPKQFWDPIDKNNERWLELKLHPRRRYTEKEASWETIIAEQYNTPHFSDRSLR